MLSGVAAWRSRRKSAAWHQTYNNRATARSITSPLITLALYAQQRNNISADSLCNNQHGAALRWQKSGSARGGSMA